MSLAPTSTCWPPISMVLTAPPRNSSAHEGAERPANRAAPSKIEANFMISLQLELRRPFAVRWLINTGRCRLFPTLGRICAKRPHPRPSLRAGQRRGKLVKDDVWGNCRLDAPGASRLQLSQNTKKRGVCQISGRTLVKRREFFKSATALTAGAAATAALATPAIAQGNITWRMVTTWPKNFPGLGVGAQRLADRITAASGGRLTVQVYAAGELVPPLQALDAVIDGSAEMSHGAAYYWQNKSQGLAFYTGVPFGMTSRELAAWVRFMGGQEIWDEIYDQFGVQGFLSGDTGTQAGGWFKHELTGVADIQGLRFRTPGLGGQVWGKLGAAVTNLAAGEIFAALQSGTLDAAEFVGPYNDLALGF